MSTIESPANEYDFGTNFNYAVWSPGTEINLVNVPWNNDYRDIWMPAGNNATQRRAALDTYIDGLESAGIVIRNMSYLKPNIPIRINLPFNTVYRFNYLRAKNPAQPVGSDQTRNLYYFILDVRYVAPNTTELVIQLDVWQTFGYDVTFGNCYIDRGHIGIANSNAMNNFGRDYLAIPEGLDTGAEYRTIHVEYPERDTWQIANAVVLIVSTVDLKADPGDVNNPKLVAASGNNAFGIPSGANVYAISLGNLQQLMGLLANVPWVSQGIISMTIIPKFKTYFNWTDTWDTNGTNITTLSDAPGATPSGGRTVTVKSNWRNDAGILGNIPSRYQGLKKFLTAPYLMIELTTFNGTAVFLRPENWQDADAQIREFINFFPPDQRVVVVPLSYNTTLTTTGNIQTNGDDGGNFLDTATMIGDFPTVPVTNNMALNYLAANKNGIAYQYQAADWSQQRALGSNQVSYDQAKVGMQTASALTSNANLQRSNLTDVANTAQMWHTGINAAGAIIGGGASGAAAGPAGAATGAAMGALNAAGQVANAAVDITARNTSTHEQNVRSRAAVNISNSLTGYVADTNKNLADWAAQGDYSTAVAGINAKVQDSKLTEPSMSGQLGGSTFNMLNISMGPSVRWKMIDPVAMRVIGEYWLRYGYAVRHFITPPSSLMVMNKFTYWKMLQSYITAAGMPEGFKQVIRGIFEKGVTVWANPSEMGNVDMADNQPLTGVSY